MGENGSLLHHVAEPCTRLAWGPPAPPLWQGQQCPARDSGVSVLAEGLEWAKGNHVVGDKETDCVYLGHA